MAELSPFLNQNPKDLAFALGQTGKNLATANGEWYEIIVTLNGRPIFSSGNLRFETLKNFSEKVSIFRRRRDKVRVRILLTRFRQSFPYQVVIPYPIPIPPPNGNGVTILLLVGTAIQSSSAMRKARARPVGFGKRTYRGYVSVPRSSSLRPSPEFLQRPFLRTNQFGTPSSYTTNQSIVPVTVYFREWSGSRTPGWGKKKKRAYVDNNHSARIVQLEENRYSWYQVQPASGNFELRIYPFTEIYPVPPAPEFHASLAEFNALKRLISNAQQGIQSNLAQNIAQVSQLSSLIVGNATKMMNSLRQLKRGNIPGAIGALGAGQVDPRWKGGKGKPSTKQSLASNWLALQYGWKPLLSDIEGFIKVMGNQIGPQDFVQKARASASVNKQVSVDEPAMGSPYPPGKTTFSYQTRCKYVIRYRLDNPLLNLFAQTGFTNPINLFWELIPFSFVVDWFLPIGSYLESFSAWDGLTFLGGSKTLFTRLRTESAVAYSGVHASSSTVNVLHYASFRNEQVRLNRQALSSFPSPVQPQFNKSGIQAGVRAANAIALLIGQMRK